MSAFPGEFFLAPSEDGIQRAGVNQVPHPLFTAGVDDIFRTAEIHGKHLLFRFCPPVDYCCRMDHQVDAPAGIMNG